MSLLPRIRVPRIRDRFWRFASPSTLVLALLLFPLPWMQIQCTGLRNPQTALTRIGVPKPVAEFVAPSQDVIVIITQSGWQAARGECARDGDWDRQLRQSKASDRADDRQIAQQWEQVEQAVRANLRPAPLMTAYPIVMLAAIALGIAAAPGRRRIPLLALPIVTALGLVGLQHVEEFPLVAAYRGVPWEQLDAQGGKPPPTPAEFEETIARDVRYTHWFWLAQYLTVAALGLVLAECCFARQPAAPIERADMAPQSP